MIDMRNVASTVWILEYKQTVNGVQSANIYNHFSQLNTKH